MGDRRADGIRREKGVRIRETTQHNDNKYKGIDKKKRDFRPNAEPGAGEHRQSYLGGGDATSEEDNFSMGRLVGRTD